MKVKDVDDLDENWRANVACQYAYAYVFKNWHLYAQPFVRSI